MSPFATVSETWARRRAVRSLWVGALREVFPGYSIFKRDGFHTLV